MLNEILDFTYSDDKGVYLNYNGKRMFVSAFYKKLYEKITVSDKTLSYMELIRIEIQKLIEYINNGTAYIPYKYY
ncbi:MAG: hypothetical protein E7591_01110 [Ruminococcaceae bacterium]|nr:hypothetical protein [Oscillospiraceae bacterium]